jgi:hypothetical protein
MQRLLSESVFRVWYLPTSALVTAAAVVHPTSVLLLVCRLATTEVGVRSRRELCIVGVGFQTFFSFANGASVSHLCVLPFDSFRCMSGKAFGSSHYTKAVHGLPGYPVHQLDRSAIRALDLKWSSRSIRVVAENLSSRFTS